MTATIIEGLKLTLTGEELSLHLVKASAHHLRKAEAYERSAEELAKLSRPTGGSLDPLGEARQRALEHRGKARYFALLSVHLDPEPTYRLSEYEAKSIELLDTDEEA